MTEGQKQALIKFIQREKVTCAELDTRDFVEPEMDDFMRYGAILEIALASLTAQPIGRVDRGEVSDNNEYPNARVVCLHDQADWENFPDGTELFLRPSPAVGMDKPEPYAWLVHAPQGDYVERNPEVVAHLEGMGLTKCKPLYLDL
ncbi:hypothetical protein ACR3LR_09215 [Pantoea eucalypti]|uniref:hypothetical protein n=1 Tax=Pantoea eucalypti TaxID=470933 RepID=UPI003EE78F73